MIPLDFIEEMIAEISPEWIKVKLKYKVDTKTFLKKNKVVTKIYFHIFKNL